MDNGSVVMDAVRRNLLQKHPVCCHNKIQTLIYRGTEPEVIQNRTGFHVNQNTLISGAVKGQQITVIIAEPDTGEVSQRHLRFPDEGIRSRIIE